MVTTERVVKGNGTNQKCIARHTRENREKKGEADCYKTADSKVLVRKLNRSQKNQMTKWKKSAVCAVQEML